MNESLEMQMRRVSEEHRAQFPNLLNAGSLRYARLGDIAAGNLIYVPLSGERIAVAMRVARLNGGVPAALVFDYWNRRGEVMHALVQESLSHAVDWGVKPIVCWHHPLTHEVPDNTRAAPDGPIVLSQSRLALRTYFGNGIGEPMYIDLKTGQEVELAEPSITIAEWSLGAHLVDGTFLELTKYPFTSRSRG